MISSLTKWKGIWLIFLSRLRDYVNIGSVKSDAFIVLIQIFQSRFLRIIAQMNLCWISAYSITFYIPLIYTSWLFPQWIKVELSKEVRSQFSFLKCFSTYYRPLMPLIIKVCSMLKNTLKKKIWVPIWALLLLALLFYNLMNFIRQTSRLEDLVLED